MQLTETTWDARLAPDCRFVLMNACEFVNGTTDYPRMVVVYNMRFDEHEEDASMYYWRAR